MCLDSAGRLVIFHLVIARIQHEEFHFEFRSNKRDERRPFVCVVHMGRGHLECQRKFTFGIDGQMQLIAKPLHFVAKRIEFNSPVGIAREFAFSLGFFFLVGVNGCAVDGDMSSAQDSSFLTLSDEILKQLLGIPHMHEFIYQDAGKSIKTEIKYFKDSSTGKMREGVIDVETNKIKFVDQ